MRAACIASAAVAALAVAGAALALQGSRPTPPAPSGRLNPNSSAAAQLVASVNSCPALIVSYQSTTNEAWRRLYAARMWELDC